MKIGIMFGCFIPLHKGHLSLIDKALNENDKIVIGVCGYDGDRGKDFISFQTRYDLMVNKYKNNPNIIIVKIDDKKLSLDGTFTLHNWDIWTKELFKQSKLNPNDPTIIYNWYMGEQGYVEKISTLFPQHKFNLVDRNVIFISGTKIRQDFIKYKGYIDNDFWNYLNNK